MAVDELPSKIAELKAEQIKLSLQIHTEKVAQAAIYRNLYGPVQHFIDNHELAKDKLHLEFRAELINDDFANRLLGILAPNRRGSFMGTDEGRERVEKFIQSAKWENAESVQTFLDNVDTALHMNQRENPPTSTQVKDQILKR